MVGDDRICDTKYPPVVDSIIAGFQGVSYATASLTFWKDVERSRQCFVIVGGLFEGRNLVTLDPERVRK